MALIQAVSPITEVEFLRLLDVAHVCFEGGMRPWHRLCESILGRTLTDPQFEEFMKTYQRVLGVTHRLNGQLEDLVERCRTYGHQFTVQAVDLPTSAKMDNPQCLYCGRTMNFWSGQQTTQPTASPNVSGNNPVLVQAVGGSGGLLGSGIITTASPFPMSVTAPVPCGPVLPSSALPWLNWLKP